MVPFPTEGREDELSASSAGFRRVAARRWSAGAEEKFLEELTATGNVARAAAAAGFSAQTAYKRRLRDKHLAAGWEAAMAVGRARLEAHLLFAANRSFDPETLPVAEGAPKVSVGEAISILKHKPAPGVSESGDFSTWQEEGEALSTDEFTALREKIIAKLARVRERDAREKSEEGWTQDGDNWIPPGWVRAES